MTARRSLAIAALALALGACSGERRGETLRFWAMGREGEVVQELIADFERENPGVKVEVQQLPWSSAHEKLLTAHVGGSLPDVTQLGNSWVSEFSAMRAIEPLDARVAASSDVRRDGFFPGIWQTNVVDSVLYGVPWYVDTRVLFYRRDLLANAGYDEMPQTWEGWRAAMQAIRRIGGRDHYAIFLPLNEWPPQMILGLQAGSKILKDGDTRGDFSGPEFRRGFEFFTSLFRDSLAPPVSNTEIANLYQEFDRGYFAMYITGPWNLGEFARRLPADRQHIWATAPLPGPDGPESGLSMAGGASLVITRSSKHKESAWKLIEFLSRPEQQTRFYRICGDLPARTESWRDSSLTNDANTRAFGVQLGRTAGLPNVPECESIAIRLQDWAERAVRGAVPPDSALARLDRDVDRMLEKRRWLAGHRVETAGAPR